MDNFEDKFKKIWELFEQIAKEHKTIAKEHKTIAKEHKTFVKEHKTFAKEYRSLIKAQKSTQEELEKLSSEVRKVTNGWGRFVEGFMLPSAVKTFEKEGYKILCPSYRKQIKENGRIIGEIDLVIPALKDGRVLFVGEAKTFVSSHDIDDFIENIKKLRQAWDEYKNYKIIGFIGGMNFGEGADKYAIRCGLYVFKPSGETMELSVPEGFSPKIW